MKILVVDDEPTIRDVVEAILEGEGHAVVTASSGQEAVERIVDERPDLIFLDIMLGDADGRDICRQLRELPAGRAARIILFSAAILPNVEACGADAFLSKPFDLEGLLTLTTRLGNG